jgi:hypothetical protein
MISGGLLRTTGASAATPDEVFDLVAGMTPLRRVTTPEEFADAALFFASPWSRAVTGQNLVVDGGLVRTDSLTAARRLPTWPTRAGPLWRSSDRDVGPHRVRSMHGSGGPPPLS